MDTPVAAALVGGAAPWSHRPDVPMRQGRTGIIAIRGWQARKATPGKVLPHAGNRIGDPYVPPPGSRGTATSRWTWALATKPKPTISVIIAVPP